MATLIQTAGRAEVGQAVRTFYNPLLFEEETQKLPEIDEVHVWSARLTLRQGSGQVSTQNKFEVFYGTLSTDERKRAQSFVQERDRNRYIIARGILRELLGHYLGMAPEQVCLSYGANGKPHLADSLAGSGLEFNLSHAANSAVYAFANRTQVGIDIEPLNKALPWRELAPIVFSAREKAELAEIPEDEKAEAFLRGWTRKEAFVKGCGAGLSLDLNAFDVPLGWLENPCPAQLSNQQTHSPGANLHSQRPARKVKHKDVFHKQSEIWWLCPIDPIADFVAALSVNGAPLKVIANRWIDDLAWVNATATVVQQSVQVATEPMPTARACASLSVQLLCQPDVLILDELESCENEAENPPGCHTPDSLAFVIFTSGSTGMPKGAMVEYKGMFNNLITKVPTLGLTERDVIAQTAGQCFDISVWQHLTALVCGARVEIFPDEIVKEPNQLLAQLAERGITVLEAVPSMIQALMDSADETMELPKLRWLIACGEAFPPELCRRWMGRFPHVKVLNAYGPAECSDDVSYYEVPVIPGETETIVPIGRPVHNTRLYLLDRWLEPVPIGVPGEICVAGVQVGRGYLNRPDLTAEKFIPDPFDDAGTRLYRTGDLGRYREDGAIEFLGRIDHQVKIRGVRIEPGEIEAQILTFPNLEQALVIVREDSAGGKRLVAYVVCSGVEISSDAELTGRIGFLPIATLPPSLAVGKLREHLAARLPNAMMPSAFVQLAAMPLGANGKIDRKALPEPDMAGQSDRAYIAPRNPAEEMLVEIWKEVLTVERVGVADNFFDLGGHSLLAVQVLSRIRRFFGIEMPLRRLFEASTIEALALLVEELLVEHLNSLSEEEAEALLNDDELDE